MREDTLEEVEEECLSMMRFFEKFIYGETVLLLSTTGTAAPPSSLPPRNCDLFDRMYPSLEGAALDLCCQWEPA